VNARTGLRRFVPAAQGDPPAAAGPNQAGPEQAGTVQAGTVQAGTAQASPEQAGPEQAGTAQAGTAQAGTAQAGTVQAGSAGPGPAAAERCEMCATEVPAEHGHVADLDQSTLICACRACYLLFTRPDAGRGRYRAVPDRYLRDPARELTVSDWDALEIPVGLAFFLHSSQRGEVVGFYPSPAGATECRLDLAEWARLAAAHPLLAHAEPDVEASLVYRGDSGVEYFLVPIDACYELAGRMRLNWRGFDGGAEARQSIAEFLDGVRARARAFSRES
jgi:hypothetical protein